MTTKSEKSAQIKSVIIEALDDLAAAVDGFAKRLESMDQGIAALNARLTTIEDRQYGDVAQGEQHHRTLLDMDNTVQCINDAVEEQGKTLENLAKIFPDIETLSQEIRSKELNEMRFDARAAMGKVAFVRMK